MTESGRPPFRVLDARCGRSVARGKRSIGESGDSAETVLDNRRNTYNRLVVDSLTATFGAFSDPTRRSLLSRLAAGPLAVGDLAAPFRISQQAISKHIAYLVRAGLVVKRRQGRRHFCALKADPFKEAAEWVGDYRQFWEQSFDRLEDYLRELQSAKQRQQESKGK
jgi:DNA-binding transcriptional ArsR family regulator